VIGDNGGARSILEKDYAAVIRRKLDDVYRNTGSAAGGKGEKAQQENFIVSSCSLF
jgi:conserved oligomeric Golgi complex subunit 4